MCPEVCSPLLLDINTCSRDEEYVTYLIKRRSGDPLPNNVTTDVNPFHIEPWNSPENTWYMFLEMGETSVRKTEQGFWREINRTEIPFNGNIGWKNTLEFHEGKAPIDCRTGYTMHEYHIQRNFEDINNIQDYTSLCRIFWQIENDNNISNEENSNSFIELNDFMSLPEIEVNSKNNENNSYCDFSNGDYLELKDILTSDTGSTSSGNSSRMTANTEEYLDPDEEFFRLLGEEEGTVQSEQRFIVTGPVQSEHVLIQPQPDSVPASVISFMAREGTKENGEDEGPSTSRTSRVKRNLSDGTSSSSCSSNGTSNNSKSPQQERKKSGIGLAKLGRKLFCFASF